MSEITSLYVFKVVGQATVGVKTRDLVEALGLDPNGPIDPARMVGSNAYYDFFEALVARDPNGLILPLRIGAAMRSDEYGAFGLAWKSAPNLRGSYLRSQRYGHVLGTAETYSMEPTQDGVFFNLEKAGDGRWGMRLSNEASLAAVAAISHEVTTSTFVPLAISFKHAPRGDVQVYEAHFDCPVYFNTGRDALLVSEECLDAPNKVGDETIAAFFDRHLEHEVGALKTDESLQQRIRKAVVQRLSEGVPSVSQIASELSLGTRTLQRRLSDQNQSFQNLVDHARKDLAQRFLRETDYSLAEIAFLTGFSEQSGFARAFKRWSGQTPRSYRLALKR